MPVSSKTRILVRQKNGSRKSSAGEVWHWVVMSRGKPVAVSAQTFAKRHLAKASAVAFQKNVGDAEIVESQ